MARGIMAGVLLLLALSFPQEALAEPEGILVEAEDFEGLEQFPIWQTVKGRWYAKEHLAAYAHCGAYAVANEFSIGAVMETTLDRELPPGKYNVWVRVVIWADSDDAVEIELNGARRVYAWTIKTKTRGYRWLPGLMTTEKGGRQLRAKAVKTGQQNFGESPRPPCKFFVLDSIYIGPADEEVRVAAGRKNDELVFGDEGVVEATTPDEGKPKPPVGNLIENGSFEAGTSHGWAALSKLDALGAAYLDASPRAHGQYSLCTKHPQTGIVLNPIVTKAYRVETPGVYTLSAFFKGPAARKASLSLMNLKRKPVLRGAIDLGEVWQRLMVSGPLRPGDYYVMASGGDFWMDGVQLEYGDAATEFRPRSAVEVGIVSEVPGRVYFGGGKLYPKLRAFASESYRGKKATVQCTVYDIWDRPVLAKKINVAFGPNRSAQSVADVLPDRLGMFRAELRVKGLEGPAAEFIFSILPEPRTMGHDPNSWLGIMPESKEYVLASLQRAGFKWMQNIRDAQVSRWCYAEPEQGKIVWHDELVGRARRYGIEPVILLHVNYNRLPKWVKPSPTNRNVPADVSLWKSFVYRMVDHYKDKVKYWQFSDDIHHFFSVDEHAMLLKATYEAAKQADPNCLVIGWRFYNREVPGWEKAMAETVPYSDVIYAGDRYVREKYRKPVHSYQFGSSVTMYNFPVFGDSEAISGLAKRRRLSCTRRASAFCRYAASVGHVDALFYYMAYLMTPPFTTGMSKQVFEHCGTVNLGAVMARMLDHFLYRMDCLGNLSPSKAVAAYHFRRENDSCVVAWSTEAQKLEVRFATALDGLELFDALGNPLEAAGRKGRPLLTLEDTPVFIAGKNVTVERMASPFSSAEVKFPIAAHPAIAAREGRVFLDVLIENNTGARTGVEVSVVKRPYFPLQWGAAEEVLLPGVEPGTQQTASFPLKYGLGRSVEFKGLRTAIRAGDISFSKNWVLWLLNSRPTGSGGVHLDGVLKEWRSFSPSRIITTHVSGATRRKRQVRTGAIIGPEELTQGRAPIIRGPEDISAQFYSQWDGQNLYLGCRFKDNAVEKGDGIEFFFDTDLVGDRADEKMSDDDFVLKYAAGTSGKAGRLKGANGATEIPAAYRQADDGYELELAVPWKALSLQPAAGRAIGFDVAVTDTDGGTLHAQMVWAGAANNWGDPTGFGVLVLGVDTGGSQ